jgi:hypothetical protein
MWTINFTICFHQLQLSRSCDPAMSGWTVSFQDILAPLHEVVRLKTQLRVCLVLLGQVRSDIGVISADITNPLSSATETITQVLQRLDILEQGLLEALEVQLGYFVQQHGRLNDN